jgi:hypothetical protein
MNKEIFNLKLDGVVTDYTNTDESLSLLIGDRKIEFSTYHDSDCCEHVYGDFSVSSFYKDKIVGKAIKAITVKSVADMGFLISFEIGYSDDTKIFIPCYNYQNGYYSDSLSLVIKDMGVETKIDISDAVEDHID